MLKGLREWQGVNRYFNAASILLIAVTGLVSVGLVILASASQSFNRAAGPGVFYKQVIFLVIALGVGGFMAYIDLERVRRYTYFLSAGVAFLLILVLIPGVGLSVKGSQRWLALGPFNLQPSDIAKLAVVFLLAHYLADNQRRIKTFRYGFFNPCVGIGIFSLLILAEPDFGTAFLCGCVGLGVLYLAGVRLLYLLPTLIGGFVLFGIAIFFNPVRLKRITAFLGVEDNKSDGAYQLWQGILAFGSGGLKGAGLGQGRQQMAFLPEAHNDFIFPVIGEELGLFFTAGIVILFLTIFIVGYMSLKRAPSLYHFCLVAGALFFITFQALINMGVVTGLLPTKGMSLPFISYGGSNLVVMFAFVGLILNIFRTWRCSPLSKEREL